jgi:hypothetical protein
MKELQVNYAGIAVSAVFAAFVVAGPLIPKLHADIALGTAANYGVLYEGTGGHNFHLTSDSGITGNVGIGGTGVIMLSGGTITGNLDFSASPGSCATSAACGGTVTGMITDDNANVTSALSTVNSLSTTLGGEAGTNVAINTSSSDQTITVNPGVTCTQIGSNCIFNVTSFSSNNGHTLTINGNSTGLNAVFNIGSAVGSVTLNSAIALSGGLNDNSVLFNIDNGQTLMAAANGATVNGIFLDPNGTINVNSVVIDGRLFGGDSSDMQIVSNAFLDQPPVPVTPEPSSIALYGTGLLVGGWFIRKRKRAHL